MDKEQQALDAFGSLLIKRVRDATIVECDLILDGQMRGILAEHMRKKLASFGPQQLEILREVIPQIVERTLHHLLWTLEQTDEMDIAVRTEAGLVPRLQDVSDGFPAELYTEDGWIARFSEQRYELYDDL